jgi:hypothetical protein
MTNESGMLSTQDDASDDHMQQADSLYNKITRTLKYVTVLGKESKTK